MIYVELLWSFFQIGLFSIGGGYAAMPLIQHQVVDLHPWLTMTQFADIMTIAEMTPGPIAIDCATAAIGVIIDAVAANPTAVTPKRGSTQPVKQVAIAIGVNAWATGILFMNWVIMAGTAKRTARTI